MGSRDGFTTTWDKNVLTFKLASTIEVSINHLTGFLVPFPVGSVIV